MKAVIYKVTNPEGLIYVGQTIDYDRRLRTYQKLRCKTQRKLYGSFIKHGVAAHTFEIVEETKQELLNERERYYVTLFNSYHAGMNLTVGGKTSYGYKHTDETKKKISIINKGRHSKYKGIPRPETVLIKMSENRKGHPAWNKGVPRTEDVKERIARKLKGGKLSEEAKRKMSVAGKGRKQNPEHIKRRIEARLKTLAERNGKE